MTVGQWINTWFDNYTGHVVDNTRVKYRGDIDNHIIPALGHVKLTELTPLMCQTFINGLVSQRTGKPLTPKSVTNIHGVLHAALDQALIMGYIRSNPARRKALKLPQAEKNKDDMNPLDTPEVSALRKVLDDGLYSVIIKLALFTGMREGEILGLQWSCVDFEQGSIRIDKQLCRPRSAGQPYYFSLPKHKKIRTIKPAPQVMQLLKRWRIAQSQQRLSAGEKWDDHGFPDLVFTYESGKYVCYEVIVRQLRKSLKAAELCERRFHDLRHTYAVLSLKAGDDIKTLSENLGHHSVTFTLDRYGHVTQTMKQDSSNRMGAFIDSL